MASNLLSDRKVLNAKAADKEYLLSDGAGLSLRVRPDGSRLWIFRYTSPSGKAAKKSIGPYPTVSLADARRGADAMRKTLSNGIDPASAIEGRPVTVSALIDNWLVELKSKRNEQGVYAATRRMEKNVRPFIGDDKLASVTKARILSILDPIVAAGHGPQANAVLIDIKQMFQFALLRDWILSNPAALIAKRQVGGADVVRERILAEQELVTLRDLLQQPLDMTLSALAAFWIAVSTLARAGEIAAIQEHEVDWDAREWHLPAGKNKSSRDHVIHLSEFAFYWLSIMREQPRPASYLFPNRSGDGPIGYNSFTHQATMRQSDTRAATAKTVRGALTLPGGRWTMHDLRRTGATMMGELGIPENVVEKCLNHAEQAKLVKVYQRAKLMIQRREAFDMLGNHLIKLLGHPKGWGPNRANQISEKVVQLRRA